MVLLLRGHGHTPYVVAGSDPAQLHADFSAALTQALDEIADIRGEARASAGPVPRRRWPMIVLRSPKGWTGPREVDGQRVEGSWRSHQVPFANARRRRAPEVPAEWMRGYEPESLFDEAGAPAPDIAALHPAGPLRMSASPHANGGLLLRDLRMPDFRDYAVEVERPAGTGSAETTRMLGGFLRDVMAGNTQRAGGTIKGHWS